LENDLLSWQEIRTTVFRQEIPVVEFTDAALSPAAASYRAQDAYAFKKLFQHSRFVIKVMAISAALPIRFFLCTKKHPFRDIHL
jgi:hypothetical protein